MVRRWTIWVRHPTVSGIPSASTRHFREMYLYSSTYQQDFATTPNNAQALAFDDIRPVCHRHTVLGLKAIFAAHSEGRTDDVPVFRFCIDEAASERGQNHIPSCGPRWCLMPISVDSSHHFPLLATVFGDSAGRSRGVCIRIRHWAWR